MTNVGSLPTLVELLYEGDKDAIEIFEERPKLPIDLEPVVQAFNLLSAQRNGASISVESIVAYLDGVCILDPVAREEYLSLLVDMDAEWSRICKNEPALPEDLLDDD